MNTLLTHSCIYEITCPSLTWKSTASWSMFFLLFWICLGKGYITDTFFASQKQKPHTEGEISSRIVWVKETEANCINNNGHKKTVSTDCQKNSTKGFRVLGIQHTYLVVISLYVVFGQYFGCCNYQNSCFQGAACARLSLRVSCCKIWNSVATNTRF